MVMSAGKEMMRGDGAWLSVDEGMVRDDKAMVRDDKAMVRGDGA